MQVFGKVNLDGTVESECAECAFTHKPIKHVSDTVRERVTGTPYFYRVMKSAYSRFTDDDREGLVRQALRYADMSNPVQAEAVVEEMTARNKRSTASTADKTEG